MRFVATKLDKTGETATSPDFSSEYRFICCTQIVDFARQTAGTIPVSSRFHGILREEGYTLSRFVL